MDVSYQRLDYVFVSVSNSEMQRRPSLVILPVDHIWCCFLYNVMIFSSHIESTRSPPFGTNLPESSARSQLPERLYCSQPSAAASCRRCPEFRRWNQLSPTVLCCPGCRRKQPSAGKCATREQREIIEIGRTKQRNYTDERTLLLSWSSISAMPSCFMRSARHLLDL